MDPHLFTADLERKPHTLRAVADAVDEGTLRWPLPPRTARVVLIGMGSSLFAAQVVALRLRRCGVIAVAESGSSEATWDVRGDDLVVGITAGGRSVETNRLFALCLDGHRVALTNTPDSDITAEAEHLVMMRAEPEMGGIACRSYTHTLVQLLALEEQLTGVSLGLATRVRAAADATDELLDTRDRWLDEVTERSVGPDGSWLLAPIERLSSSLQGALMLRECPRRAAVGCETGEWSHIDVYLTKTLDYRALVFPGSRWDAQAAAWLTERNATVVSVGGTFPGAHRAIRFRGDDDPIVALLTETLVPELVAANLWNSG